MAAPLIKIAIFLATVANGISDKSNRFNRESHGFYVEDPFASEFGHVPVNSPRYSVSRDFAANTNSDSLSARQFSEGHLEDYSDFGHHNFGTENHYDHEFESANPEFAFEYDNYYQNFPPYENHQESSHYDSSSSFLENSESVNGETKHSEASAATQTASNSVSDGQTTQTQTIATGQAGQSNTENGNTEYSEASAAIKADQVTTTEEGKKLTATSEVAKAQSNYAKNGQFDHSEAGSAAHGLIYTTSEGGVEHSQAVELGLAQINQTRDGATYRTDAAGINERDTKHHVDGQKDQNSNTLVAVATNNDRISNASPRRKTPAAPVQTLPKTQTQAASLAVDLNKEQVEITDIYSSEQYITVEDEKVDADENYEEHEAPWSKRGLNTATLRQHDDIQHSGRNKKLNTHRTINPGTISKNSNAFSTVVSSESYPETYSPNQRVFKPEHPFFTTRITKNALGVADAQSTVGSGSTNAQNLPITRPVTNSKANSLNLGATQPGAGSRSSNAQNIPDGELSGGSESTNAQNIVATPSASDSDFTEDHKSAFIKPVAPSKTLKNYNTDTARTARPVVAPDLEEKYYIWTHNNKEILVPESEIKALKIISFYSTNEQNVDVQSQHNLHATDTQNIVRTQSAASSGSSSANAFNVLEANPDESTKTPIRDYFTTTERASQEHDNTDSSTIEKYETAPEIHQEKYHVRPVENEEITEPANIPSTYGTDRDTRAAALDLTNAQSSAEDKLVNTDTRNVIKEPGPKPADTSELPDGNVFTSSENVAREPSTKSKENYNTGRNLNTKPTKTSQEKYVYTSPDHEITTNINGESQTERIPALDSNNIQNEPPNKSTTGSDLTVVQNSEPQSRFGLSSTVPQSSSLTNSEIDPETVNAKNEVRAEKSESNAQNLVVIESADDFDVSKTHKIAVTQSEPRSTVDYYSANTQNIGATHSAASSVSTNGQNGVFSPSVADTDRTSVQNIGIEKPVTEYDNTDVHSLAVNSKPTNTQNEHVTDRAIDSDSNTQNLAVEPTGTNLHTINANIIKPANNDYSVYTKNIAPTEDDSDFTKDQNSAPLKPTAGLNPANDQNKDAPKVVVSPDSTNTQNIPDSDPSNVQNVYTKNVATAPTEDVSDFTKDQNLAPLKSTAGSNPANDQNIDVPKATVSPDPTNTQNISDSDPSYVQNVGVREQTDSAPTNTQNVVAQLPCSVEPLNAQNVEITRSSNGLNSENVQNAGDQKSVTSSFSTNDQNVLVEAPRLDLDTTNAQDTGVAKPATNYDPTNTENRTASLDPSNAWDVAVTQSTPSSTSITTEKEDVSSPTADFDSVNSQNINATQSSAGSDTTNDQNNPVAQSSPSTKPKNAQNVAVTSPVVGSDFTSPQDVYNTHSATDSDPTNAQYVGNPSPAAGFDSTTGQNTEIAQPTLDPKPEAQNIDATQSSVGSDSLNAQNQDAPQSETSSIRNDAPNKNAVTAGSSTSTEKPSADAKSVDGAETKRGRYDLKNIESTRAVHQAIESFVSFKTVVVDDGKNGRCYCTCDLQSKPIAFTVK